MKQKLFYYIIHHNTQILLTVKFKYKTYNQIQMESMQDKAIKLITVDQQGKYVIHQDGIDFLKQIPAPIAVVSVAGLYRTGKSYLLNRMLLNRSNGFGVGPTVNPCTKGLWCWGNVVKGTTQQGQKINVVIIDSQGIGALDQDQTHDTRIFTLAILLASSFIYNSVGSIDENALQNLSLIVNLTKNIQLNSMEEDDPDQLAQYFPSFYWVVRDFSLQLINSQGQTITTKDYLQRALSPQKGFSDDIQQKNRIRRLLTSFFKQRQCITLVRPLVDQSKLQLLDKLELQQLRPQFVDQVINFRRRILGKVKPKTFKGKQLNGQMYLHLIGSYVNSINNGAIPNIQNAWNYMCSQQCSKILQESLEIFNKFLNTTIQLPCSQEQFYVMVERMEDQVYQFFEKNCIGENTKSYYIELKKRIKVKIKQTRLQNQKQSTLVHKKDITKNFTPIEKKIKNNDFKNFQQFMKCLGIFYTGALQNNHNYPNKQITYLDFFKKIIPQAAEIYLRLSQSQLEKIKIMSEEQYKHLDEEYQKYRSKMEQKYKEIANKQIDMQRESFEYKKKIQEHAQQMQKLEQKHELTIRKLQSQKVQKILKYEKIQYENQQQLNDLKERLKNSQNQINQMKKQFEKDHTVNEIKVRRMVTQLQQLKIKQQQYEVILNNQNIQYDLKIKQLTHNFQKHQLELENKIKNQKEKQNQLLQQHHLLEMKFDQRQLLYKQKQDQIKQELNNKHEQITKLKTQNENVNNKIKHQLANQQEQLAQKYTKLLQQKQHLQANFQTISIQYTQFQQKSQTQVDIIKQKMSFLQTQLSETNDQLKRLRQFHDNQMQSMEQMESDRLCNLQLSKIQQVQQSYTSTIRSLESQIETMKDNYRKEIEQLNKVKENMELDFKLVENNLQQLTKQLKYQNSKLEQQLSIEIEAKKQNQSKINQLIKTQQSTYLTKISHLQQELQQMKEISLNERNQLHSQSEESVRQLKNFYELEKDKLQMKLNSQKEKYQRKTKHMLEQYQRKLRDQTEYLEESNQQLRAEFENMNSLMEETISKLQNQCDIKAKTVQNLEKNMGENKQKFQKYEKELNAKLQRTVQSMQSQKQTLYTKIDELHQTNNKLQRQIMNLTHHKQQLSSSLSKNELTNKQLNEDISSIKSNYEQIIQENRVKVSQLNNQFMQKKINYEKQIALMKQQNQYYEKKIREIEKVSDNNSTIYEQKIKKIKDEYSVQIKIQMEKYTNEINNWEHKYQKLKKNYKESETTMLKAINNHQRERAIQHQKYLGLQLKIKENQTLKANQSENYHSQLNILKQTLTKQKKDLEQQLAFVKKQFSMIQNEKNNITSKNDRQILLLQNKIYFLQQNKQKTKKQATQKIQKLETTIQNLQKSKFTEKQKNQTAHNQYINKIKKQYHTQIQQLNQANAKKQAKNEMIVKKLENQLRDKNEKLAVETQSRMGSLASNEKKLKQYQINEKKLLAQVEKLRSQKQNQNSEYYQTIEKQKQTIKTKMNEKEQKYKNIEKQKQKLFFQYQKQKAKWNLEKDTYTTKQDELKQTISKYQRDLQRLQRQNEKLRVEKKCNKISLPSNRYSNYSLQKGLSRSSLDDTLKQNYSPLGDMSYFNQ